VAQAYRHTALQAIEAARFLEIPILNMHLSEGVYFTLPEEPYFTLAKKHDCRIVLETKTIRALRESVAYVRARAE